MQNTTAKTNFNISRNKLSLALNDLENSVKQKLQDVQNDKNIVLNHEFAETDSLIHQQKIQIANLSNEINNLQKNLIDNSKENELLHSKINGNVERKLIFKNHIQELTELLENKLKNIESIIHKL
jgi:hypothetical protein